MKKVLLRRDVITASFVAKFEAGQESARNTVGRHLQELKEGSQSHTERAQVGTVRISCDISLIYRGKELTSGHHTLCAPVSSGAMVERKVDVLILSTESSICFAMIRYHLRAA